MKKDLASVDLLLRDRRRGLCSELSSVEDRYLQYVWEKCSVVVDADDNRSAKYGEFYTRKKPLNSAALKIAEGYRTKPPK